MLGATGSSAQPASLGNLTSSRLPSTPTHPSRTPSCCPKSSTHPPHAAGAATRSECSKAGGDCKPGCAGEVTLQARVCGTGRLTRLASRLCGAALVHPTASAVILHLSLTPPCSLTLPQHRASLITPRLTHCRPTPPHTYSIQQPRPRRNGGCAFLARLPRRLCLPAHGQGPGAGDEGGGALRRASAAH